MQKPHHHPGSGTASPDLSNRQTFLPRQVCCVLLLIRSSKAPTTVASTTEAILAPLLGPSLQDVPLPKVAPFLATPAASPPGGSVKAAGALLHLLATLQLCSHSSRAHLLTMRV